MARFTSSIIGLMTAPGSLTGSLVSFSSSFMASDSEVELVTAQTADGAEVGGNVETGLTSPSSPAAPAAAADAEDLESRVADDMAAIVDRIAASEFPMVLPQQQTSLNEDDASHILQFVQKSEAVKIQSFMHEKYRLFRSDAIVDVKKSEAVIHAEWARECYYPLLKQFSEERARAVNDVLYDALYPLLDAAIVSSDSLVKLRETLGRIPQEKVASWTEYLDAQWSATLSLFPRSLRQDENAMRRTWLSHECLALANSFHAEVTKSKWTFSPEIPVHQFPNETARAVASSLYDQVQENHVARIEDAVDTAYGLLTSKLPSFASTGIDSEIRKHFLLEQYCEIIRCVLSEAPTEVFEFVPEISAMDFPTEAEQRKASDIFAQVKKIHVLEIEAAVESAYSSVEEKLPVYMRAGVTASLRREMLLTRYLDIISSIVNKDCGGSSFTFAPLVAVSDISDPIKRQSAEELVERVKQEHIKGIDALVQQRLNSALENVPETIRQKFGEQITKNWMLEKYFDVVAEVVSGTKCHAAADIAAPSEISSENISSVSSNRTHSDAFTGSGIFASPKKRSRGAAIAAGPAVLTSKSVCQVHEEEHFTSDAICVKGVLLHFPEEPRWVKTTDKKTRQEIDIPVMNLLLADGSSPLQIELWRGSAEQAHRDIREWSTSNDESLFVEIRHAWARLITEDSRNSMPRMRRLVSSSRTIVARISHDDFQASGYATLPLSPSLYTSDFNVLTTAVPFIVSIAGVVTSVEDERPSESGNPMKSFKLQDDSGRYVLCTALGRHVDNQCLVDNNFIVMYLVKGAAGRNRNVGQLWIYDDSHLVFLSTRPLVGPARVCMELRQG